MTDQPFERPTGSAPQSLIRLLQDFTLEANRYVDSAGARNDMHRTDLNALAVIMRHTAKGLVVTPGVLRKELHLSSPATTALIDRLDNSGHVVRERHASDRRQVQLRMTPKAYRDGSTSANDPNAVQDGGAMFMPLSRHMGAAMAAFSPEELELVTRFMTAMVEATVAARHDASGGGPASPPSPPGQAPSQ